uniref:Uncharacterized protein n=1 Tax=Faecalibaculum rodentium TaxID=1702221 RepID=A0A140DRD8_9FIRM|nr:hypothetical protein AALO17_00810 [Faecalibaculum rodentium]
MIPYAARHTEKAAVREALPLSVTDSGRTMTYFQATAISI